MESLSKFFLKKEPCRKSTSELKSSFDETDGKDVIDGSYVDASGRQIFFQIIFGFMCIGDTGSDIFTSYFYAKGHEFWFFWLTLIITIVASLIIIVINMFSYYQEYIEMKKEQLKQDRKHDRPPPSIWFLRILCSLLFVGPFLRYFETAWYYIKVRRVRNYTDRRYYIARIKATRETSAILTIVESYTEAAPQLTLQLYIMLNQGPQSSLRLMVQTVSCFLSWVSCTYALVSQAQVHKQKEKTDSQSVPLSYLDLFLMFVWRFLMVGPRILAFSLLASVASYYVVLSLILGHWILWTIYVVSRRFPSESNFVVEILISFVIGFVFIFTDWNTTNGHKRLPYIVYYVIVFAENVSMVAVWFLLTPNSHEWYHLAGIIFIIVGFGIGVIFMIFYYVNFKPCHLNCCNRQKANNRNGVQYSVAGGVEIS